MPSTVGTSTRNEATNHPSQVKTFIAEGREWVFYSDGTNVVFRSRVISPLGSWSAATTFKSGGVSGYAISLWWDGTKVHTVSHGAVTGGMALFYRCGTPNSDGTITWETERTAVAGVSGKYQSYMTVCVDSAGYPVVAYSLLGASYYYPRIVIATATDGSTWGSPITLDTEGTAHKVMPLILPLADRKLLAIWCNWQTGKTVSKYYNGTSWGAINNIGSREQWGVHSAIVLGTKVICLIPVATNDINAYEWTADTWGSATMIRDGTVGVISKAGDNAYAFIRDGTKLYYAKYTGTWGTPVEWQTTTDWQQDWNFGCGYSGDGRIGVYWLEGTASPYNVRYKAFTYGAARSQGFIIG